MNKIDIRMASTKRVSRERTKTRNHYLKMIVWAKTQPKRGKVDSHFMWIELGEDWYGDSCAYCNKYYKLMAPHCNSCPLIGLEGEGSHCCNGLWEKMDNAKTWGTWIKCALDVLKYIEKHG